MRPLIKCSDSREPIGPLITTSESGEQTGSTTVPTVKVKSHQGPLPLTSTKRGKSTGTTYLPQVTLASHLDPLPYLQWQ